MEATRFKEGISVISTDMIDARKLFTSPACEAIQINLEPGGEIEKHSTEENVIFYVVRGKVTATIGDERAEAGEQTVIPCKGGMLKGLLNTGTETASVLVVKLKT